jgi:hypothetical protein
MGVSKSTPPGSKTAAIQNEAVRSDFMGGIFPLRWRYGCDLHHEFSAFLRKWPRTAIIGER